jgi:hypothetical protein
MMPSRSVSVSAIELARRASASRSEVTRPPRLELALRGST